MWVGVDSLSDTEIQEIQKEQKLKEAFAVALLQWPTEPIKAAIAVEPYNSGRAEWLAAYWVNDPYVKAHQAKMLLDPTQLLPSKVHLSSIAMSIAQDKFQSTTDRLKALRYCSDLQGFTGNAVNNVILNAGQSSTNKVMEVPRVESVDSWESAAKRQQTDLTTAYTEVVDEK